jgi:hypothetical protein
MKHILVPANYTALVFKNKNLSGVLGAGSHWIGFGASAEMHNMSDPFLPSQELNVLLQNAELASMLEVIDLSDNEIGLLYKDGNFLQVITAGRFVFWKGATRYTVVKADLRNLYIDESIDKNLHAKGYLHAYTRHFLVNMFEKGLLLVNGKLVKVLDPGLYFYWKNTDSVDVVCADLRQKMVDIAGQEVLTKDKAQLRINCTVQYRVVDIVKALMDNKEYERQLYIFMQMTLRDIVGKLSFDELMENKELIARESLAIAVEKAQTLGIEIADLGIKDIILPGDVKEIMNQVLVAEKRAQANVIMRREETASTRSLLNTAKLMEENAMLFKLKEMEYVEKIAEKIHTITLSGGGQVVDQLKQLFVK